MFGIGSALVAMLAYSLPIQVMYADPIAASSLLAGMISALYFVDISKAKDSFYPLFIASLLAFLCFVAGIELYFKLRFTMVELELLPVLILGLGLSFVFSFFANAIRKQKASK